MGMLIQAILGAAHGRGGGPEISPADLLVGAAVVVAIIMSRSKPAREAIKNLKPGRHSWTSDEHRAVIKFYLAHRKLDPQRFEEEVLKLSKQLGVSPNAARVQVKAVEALADPTHKKGPGATKALREQWEAFKEK